MTVGGVVSNYAVGVYRSKDPIRNFKLKVTLKRATGGSIKDYSNDVSEGKDGVPLKELKKLQQNIIQEADKSNKEDAIISWQMKIFSKREFSKYTTEINEISSILEKNYVEECKKLKEKGYQPGRIFTYIDADPFNYSDEVNDDLERIPENEIPSYLEKTQSNLRKRRPLVGKGKSSEVVVPRMNIVNYLPNKDEKKNLNSTKFQKMYIMADLSSNVGTSFRRTEFVLCCVQVDANGSVVVKPDFNDANSPYIVETGGFGNESYEFIIENASNQITNDDLIREIRLHQELYKRHMDYVKNLVGTEFNIPEKPKILNLHIFGEIISAKNFDYDDLHVYYQLDLPRNWYSDTTQATSGFTVTSRTICVDEDEVAYFSHPFEFDVYYCNDEDNDDKKDEVPHMPKIYFEVASYDSWSRYRTEGYSWIQVPSQPGTIKEGLTCWRPRGDSFIYELRRFFIGGSPELEDISYVAVPSNHEGSILSRFGFRTTTTGILNVKMGVAFQSHVFLDKKLTNRKQIHLMDKIGNYSKINDIMNVLDAFNQARNRMKEARENTRKILEN